MSVPKIQFSINQALKDKVVDLAEEKGLSESQVAREIFIRGLELDDLKQERMMIESLCLLRRLVADKDPALWQQAKKDATAIMVKLGIELEQPGR